jgi:hypothetical protein
MGARLLAALALLCFAITLTGPTAAAPGAGRSIALPQWNRADWWRGCASLDLDFYNDRYYINSNISCDGTTGTQYSGVANFISGTGATFTRAGTTNVNSISPPFYLNTATQSFVSRASVTNNVTSTFAPFFIGTTGNGPSQSFVSRASTGTYFNSSGTLQTQASGSGVTGARSAAYYYNGSSWVLGGTLIEAAATNSVPNNTMSGAVVADGVQRATNGSFNSCSGSTCTGWTTNLNGGTGSVSYGSNTATLTGDGTNAASIYQQITGLTSGYTYTFSVTNGSGNAVTMQVGSTLGGNQYFGAVKTAAAGATSNYNFTASGTSVYIQINNISLTAANVTTVSVQSAGKFPTGWSLANNDPGLTVSLYATGTENGISYTDWQIVGTASINGENGIVPVNNGVVSTTIGQTWTGSFYVAGVSGTSALTKGKVYAIGSNGVSGTESAVNQFTTFPSSATLSPNQYPATRTMSSTATTYALTYFAYDYTAGTTINAIVRLGMPQLEQGSTATSVIATSSTAVTRAADIYNQQPASYFDGTGTLYFAAANAARDNHNPTSPYADLGTLIEPAATNSIRNNMMVGAAVADGVERTNNGTFSNTPPNVCTGSVTSGSNTLSCYNGTGTGWVGTVNAGSGSVTAATGSMTLTGDGTNAASIYEAISTTSVCSIDISVTVGSGSAITLQVGTSIGASNELSGYGIAANTTTQYTAYVSGTTNYVQINNSNVTAATVTALSVKSAGCASTNWPYLNAGPGLSASILNVGTFNGIYYEDIQVTGTTTSTALALNQAFEQGTQINASNGQTWTNSVYLALISGTIPNQLKLVMTEVNSSGNVLQYDVSSNLTLNSTLTRYTSTPTLSNASTAYVQPGVWVYSTGAGQSVNFTLRIGMPQIEKSSYSTSVIPTFGSAVTRTADVYSNPNGGTYFNSSGVLTNAAANTPRLDHNPVSPYSPRGILIEEGRTNLITYSVPDGGTNWTYAADNTAGTANATTAPDGTTTAASLADNSTTGAHYAAPTATIAVTSGNTYNFSVFVKPSTATDVQLVLPSPPFTSGVGGGQYTNFNLTSGTIASGVTSNAAIQALSNGWYRLSLYATANSTASTAPVICLTNNITTGGIEPSYSGSGESLYIWGAQFEAGQNPTSYIPTYGSTVARATDVFTVPGTAGGGWLSNNVGTFGTEGMILNLTGNAQGFAGLDNGASNQAVNDIVGASGNRASTFYSSGQTYLGNVSGYTTGATTKIAFGYSATYENGAADGTGYTSGTVAPPATQSRLTIGHSRGTSTGDLDGWITRIWYMPVIICDACLTDITR